MTALVIDRLAKNFGGLQALHDLSLEIQPGERRVILGPNGAGKTTLFHLIGGQLSPSAGRLFLCGQEVTHLPPFRRAALGLARTFQLTTLFPNLTVLENMLLAVQALDTVRFVLYRPLTSYQHLLRKAQNLLEQWNLWEKRRALVRQLSYGEQRQIEILLALAHTPKVLLLDEPTAGLSTAETQQVVAMLQHLDPGITVLLIEHDMAVAFQVAQHITVLQELGRIIRQLKAEGLSMLLVEQNLPFALQLADYVYVMSKGRMVYEAPPHVLAQNEEVKAQYLGI